MISKVNFDETYYYVTVSDPLSRTEITVTLDHDDGWPEAISRFVDLLQGMGFCIDKPRFESAMNHYWEKIDG